MKTKRLTSKRTVEVDDTETIIACDLCNNKVYHERHCCICQRDICDKCSKYDRSDISDYPPRYCKECWEIGIEYREKIKNVHLECNNKIEQIRNQWEEKAKKQAVLIEMTK